MKPATRHPANMLRSRQTATKRARLFPGCERGRALLQAASSSYHQTCSTSASSQSISSFASTQMFFPFLPLPFVSL